MPITWEKWSKSKRSKGYYARLGRDSKGKIYLQYKYGKKGTIKFGDLRR